MQSSSSPFSPSPLDRHCHHLGSNGHAHRQHASRSETRQKDRSMKKKQRETRFFWNHWKLGVMFKISTPRRLKSIQNIWNHIFDRRCETVDRKKESGRIKETRLLYKFIMTINWGLCFLYTSFSSEAGACCLFTHDEYHKKKRSQIAGYKPLISSPSLNTSVASMPRTLSVFFFFPSPQALASWYNK